jgi:hypothetical protein
VEKKMHTSPSEMALMVFKHTLPTGFFEFHCNSHMLRILMMLDGTSNMGIICQKTGIPLKEAAEAISQLQNQKLVTMTDNGIAYLDEDFLNFLETQLSVAVGPVAEILIDDAIKDLGHQAQSFPIVKAADLVLALVKDINREDKKIEFQRKMMARIKQG